MTIAWEHFTPFASLGGGILIGLAAALLLLANGRIAGISGIAGGLLRPARGDIGWRLAFLLGLVTAPLVWLVFRAMPPVQIDHSPALLTVAGLLVGIGTRFGSGCTSGHGVCGISRLSPRSLVATLGFMLAGFATVYVVRHVMG
jgi:uncharacterized membrane protein YedE/YeeE